jgi:LemA protein
MLNMELIGAAVFVLFVIVAVIAIYEYVVTQRKLVDLDEKCNNALSQIEVQLNSRWDALMALAKAATSYARHEGETLAATIAARRGVEIRTAADVAEQQDAYAEVLSRLMAVNESYPELKSSDLYAKTMDSIRSYEENVRMARMIYNDSATRMNRYVRQWPSSIIASHLNFGLREYLKADDKQKKGMPELFGEGSVQEQV